MGAGIFGSVARSLGGVGSDIFNAKQMLAQIQQQIAKQKLDDIQKQLGIKQAQGNLDELPLRIQQLKQQAAMQTPEGRRTYLKSLLGREPTENEVLQFEGLAPKLREGTGRPIPGEQIEREKGTWWLPILDPQQNVTGYVQTGAPAGTGTNSLHAPATRNWGGFTWQFDPNHELPGTRKGAWVQLGQSKVAAPPKPKSSNVVTPDERRRQLEYRMSASVWNSKLQKLQADYKTAQASWIRGGSVDEAKTKLDNMQKAVDYINSEQDEVYTGKAALADVLKMAQDIADGNI